MGRHLPFRFASSADRTAMLPTIHGRRLQLRPLRPGDAAAIARLCAERAVARMTARIPHPYPPALAERWVATQQAEAAAARELVFAIALQGEGGELIGCIGLEPAAPGSYELGYWIGRPWWGRGYATEAAGLVVDFAFEALRAACLTAGHFADNPASRRVLEKCGFKPAGSARRMSVARGTAVETLLLRLDRPAPAAQGERAAS